MQIISRRTTNMKKRIFNIFLTIVMVVGLILGSALTAFTVEGAVASVTTADGTTNYTDIADALAAAQASEGSTLTLLDNITTDP